MTALQSIEKIGNEAVQELRLQKLRNGHPFMINSKELESNQCYLEYPDGRILLVYLKNGAREFTMIRMLSSNEAESLRKRYGLSSL
jgi:hypothetical protein